jgi:hypothetical protein
MHPFGRFTAVLAGCRHRRGPGTYPDDRTLIDYLLNDQRRQLREHGLDQAPVTRHQPCDALMLINVIGYPEKTVPAWLRLARNPLLRRCLPRSATERGLREAVGASRRTITAIV